MAYRIEYGNTINKTFFKLKKKTKRSQSFWMVVFVCLTVLGYTALCYKDVLLINLLPGDAAVTASAITTLVNDVKSGECIGEAVTTFCREIIQNAAISQ